MQLRTTVAALLFTLPALPQSGDRREIGRAAAEAYLTTAPPLEHPELAGWLNQIANRLAESAPTPTQLSVTLTADSNPRNAVLAWPGGYVALSARLIAAAASEEQVATALARAVVIAELRFSAAVQDGPIRIMWTGPVVPLGMKPVFERQNAEAELAAAAWIERADFAGKPSGGFLAARRQAREAAPPPPTLRRQRPKR